MVDLWAMLATNVYAKFRCALLCIKKALEIFGVGPLLRELIPTRRTTRVAFWDTPPGSLSYRNTWLYVRNKAYKTQVNSFFGVYE